MNAHDDYWWHLDRSLFFADAYIDFAKMAEANARNGYIVPYPYESAARWSEYLLEEMKALSLEDRIIIRELIAEAMR